MTAAQLAMCQADIVDLLETDGFIAGTPPDFVPAKFEDVAAVSKLATDVTAVLTKYGVPIPPKVSAVIGALPLFFQLEQVLAK